MTVVDASSRGSALLCPVSRTPALLFRWVGMVRRTGGPASARARHGAAEVVEEIAEAESPQRAPGTFVGWLAPARLRSMVPGVETSANERKSAPQRYTACPAQPSAPAHLAVTTSARDVTNCAFANLSLLQTPIHSFPCCVRRRPPTPHLGRRSLSHARFRPRIPSLSRSIAPSLRMIPPRVTR